VFAVDVLLISADFPKAQSDAKHDQQRIASKIVAKFIRRKNKLFNNMKYSTNLRGRREAWIHREAF
jgi:hypothetical protein